MRKALILTNAYYDESEQDHDLLVRPTGDVDGVILEPWPNRSNGMQISITREELLAILELAPVG